MFHPIGWLQTPQFGRTVTPSAHPLTGRLTTMARRSRCGWVGAGTRLLPCKGSPSKGRYLAGRPPAALENAAVDQFR